MTAFDEPRLDHDARCAIWKGADVVTGCTCHDDQGYAPRTPWADGPWLAFDTETTGVDVAHDRIVTATLVIHTPGTDLLTHTWLADPGIEIPQAATDVHGVTTDHAREHGRPAAAVVGEVATILGAHWSRDLPLIGFNVCFDLSLLDAELRRHHHQALELGGPVVDPRVIDKQIDRYRKGKRTLTDICAHYRVRLDGAHDATADALAAARVAWRIAKDNPAIGTALLEDLHRQQQVWFASQQRSFAGYLRRTARGLEDPQEREKLLQRADRVEAEADAWPLRSTS